MTGPLREVAWDEAGVRLASGLSRRVASVAWQVPAQLELGIHSVQPSNEGARDEVCLHWNAFQRISGPSVDQPLAPWKVREPRNVREAPRLLDRFVALADGASEGRVLAFARRWGVLQLCGDHGLPASHAPPPHGFVGNVHLGCRPVSMPGWDGVEPLYEWRRYARRARGLLNVAAALHVGRVAAVEDWQAALAGWREPGRPKGLSTVPWWKRSVGADGRVVDMVIDLWLFLGNVRPRFSWTDSGSQLALGGDGLVGALALQLMLAISRTDGLAMCSSCGVPYIPFKRPTAARRRYCSKCRKAGVPLRDAQRALRARAQVSANRT